MTDQTFQREIRMTVEEGRARELAEQYGSIEQAVLHGLNVVELFDDPDEVRHLAKCNREDMEP